MATAKIQTGLRIDPELYYKLVTLAKIEGRSLNNMTEYAIRQYVEAYEEDHGKIVQPIEGQLSVQEI